MALSFWHLGHPVPVNRLTVCPQEDTEDVPGTGENLFGAEPRPCCASLMLSAPATLTGCRTLASEFLLPVLFHVGETPILLPTWHLIAMVPLPTFYLGLLYLGTCLCPTQPVNTWTALCSSFKEYLTHTQARHLLSHLTLTTELGRDCLSAGDRHGDSE